MEGARHSRGTRRQMHLSTMQHHVRPPDTTPRIDSSTAHTHTHLTLTAHSSLGSGPGRAALGVPSTTAHASWRVQGDDYTTFDMRTS